MTRTRPSLIPQKMRTVAPTGTRGYISSTSSMFMRTQPCEACVPIDAESYVPWIRIARGVAGRGPACPAGCRDPAGSSSGSSAPQVSGAGFVQVGFIALFTIVHVPLGVSYGAIAVATE